MNKTDKEDDSALLYIVFWLIALTAFLLPKKRRNSDGTESNPS